MVVTFFGHRDTPSTIRPALQSQIEILIKNHNDCLFYVGNHGNFDSMVIRILSNMKRQFPHIRCVVTLAYMPSKNEGDDFPAGIETVVPDGIESTLPRYAIIKRNRWMVERADVVLTYVRHTTGGAYKFMELARKKQKQVINLTFEESLPMG